MRVLVVEDYEVIREGLVQGLQERGFAVDATGDGIEGKWYATSNDYDLLLLDIMLPGLSGLEILRAVRAQGKDVPVLLLTAKDEVEDRVRGLDLGADDYLVKPFAIAELFARVRSLTRRGHHARTPAITVGDLVIDSATRSVRRGTQDIVLTPREYALLEFLALRAGEVVARSELWEHLYSFSDDSTSNVIEATVLRLRRKLSPADEPPLLHTRRGFGYVLSAEAAP
jgi:DNA-binding response OmpR family regulator